MALVVSTRRSKTSRRRDRHRIDAFLLAVSETHDPRHVVWKGGGGQPRHDDGQVLPRGLASGARLGKLRPDVMLSQPDVCDVSETRLWCYSRSLQPNFCHEGHTR